MRVMCDICPSEAATVFCCADEAVLCDDCDRRVHLANKLAGKHRRYPLVNPQASSSSSSSSSSSASSSLSSHPLCDICQEKRGLLFCKEDRAILCRDCDAPIHTATSATMKHSRFLLTGVQLSPAPLPSSPVEEPDGASTLGSAGWNIMPNVAAMPPTDHDAAFVGGGMPQYLTDTLPGWHAEEISLMNGHAATAGCADGIYQEEEVMNAGHLSEVFQAANLARQEQQQLFYHDQPLSGVPLKRELWVPEMGVDWAGNNSRSRSLFGYW